MASKKGQDPQLPDGVGGDEGVVDTAIGPLLLGPGQVGASFPTIVDPTPEDIEQISLTYFSENDPPGFDRESILGHKAAAGSARGPAAVVSLDNSSDSEMTCADPNGKVLSCLASMKVAEEAQTRASPKTEERSRSKRPRGQHTGDVEGDKASSTMSPDKRRLSKSPVARVTSDKSGQKEAAVEEDSRGPTAIDGQAGSTDWRGPDDNHGENEGAEDDDEDVFFDCNGANSNFGAGLSSDANTGDKNGNFEGESEADRAKRERLKAKRKAKSKRWQANRRAKAAVSNLESETGKLKLQALAEQPAPEQGSGPSPPSSSGAGKKRAASALSTNSVEPKRNKLMSSSLFRSYEKAFQAPTLSLRGAKEGGDHTVSPPASLFSPYGAVDIQLLKEVAHSLQDVLPGPGEGRSDLGQPALGGHLVDHQGLEVLELDPLAKHVSRVSIPLEGRTAGVPLGQPLRFSSSRLSDLLQRVVGDGQFTCSRCVEPHWPLPQQPKVVLVTFSEAVAACAQPRILTCSGMAQPNLARGPTDECWDYVWIPGGLKGNAFEILKSIYASYAGPLQILLHLGTLAVEDKWTAESVMESLVALCGRLRGALRKPRKGLTGVLVLPPFINMGDKHLALNQGPAVSYTRASFHELCRLRSLVDNHNKHIVQKAGLGTVVPLHQWSYHFSRAATSGDRTSNGLFVQKVDWEAHATIEGSDGALHLDPHALQILVRRVVKWVRCAPYITW